VINHFINDGYPAAGGAQKIMHQLYGASKQSRIYAFDYFKTRSGVHGKYSFLRCYAKFLWLFFFDKKQVLVLHHRIFLLPVIIFRRKNLYFVCHNIFPDKNWVFNYIKSGRFIAVSESVKSYLLEFNGDFDISVIENGVSFDKESMKVSSENDIYKIAFVGRLSEQKGVDLLIKAFIDFNKEIPKSELIIIGDGEDKAKYQKMACNISSVTFKGYSQYPFRECSVADVVVVPSRYEGFGLVYYEALEYRHTVIASNLEVFYKKPNDSNVIFFEREDYIDLREKLLVLYNSAKHSIISDSRHEMSSLQDMLGKYSEVFKGEG
tara:strand:+ start:3608 stop:4570 length:963 start_codon:yes stop_codon:yes gene_type:complete